MGLDGEGRAALVGESPAWRAVLDVLPRLAASERPLLVTGETGTGKASIARTVHALSLRRGQALRWLSCGAPQAEVRLGEGLQAVSSRRSPSEGVGMLVLVGVEDASPGLQCALTQWCPDSSVGPERPRIIALARRPLEPLVQSGALRAELYFRLAGHRLELPALRERGNDVRLLLRHGLAQCAARLGVAAPEPAPRLLEVLIRHLWPGNVRELLNACAHAIEIAGARTRVDVEHWPSPPFVAGHAAGLGLHAETHALEGRRLREALARTHGNKTQAARALGLSRQGFLQKLNRHGLGDRPALDADRGAV